MTPQELEKIQSALELGIRTEHSEQLTLFNSSEFDKSKYLQYLLSYKINKVEIYGEYITDVCELVNDFIQEHKEQTGIEISSIDTFEEVERDFDDYFQIESYGYEYKYYEVCDTTELDRVITQKRHENLAKLLNINVDSYTITPDCKLIQLFKDGNIDWLTLQKLTYTNCDL